MQKTFGYDKAVITSYSIHYTKLYDHTLRAGSEWLIKNRIEKAQLPEGKKIVVATNLSTNTQYYFRHLQDKVSVRYIRYYERGNSDWDYAVLANSYIDPNELRRGYWPPKNTIKTFDVDGKAVCAVLERKNRYDLEGYQLLQAKQPAAAIPYFEKAVKADDTYEP